MARTDKLYGINRNTFIRQESGFTIIRYHETDIVRFNATTIILSSGGWNTVSTANKMTAASRQFKLGFYVRCAGGKRVHNSNNLLHKQKNPTGARLEVTYNGNTRVIADMPVMLPRMQDNPLPESAVEAMASTDTENA